MTYYGKNEKELTELEKELLHVDRLIINSMVFNLKGESLIGQFLQAGTPEDIEEKMYIRAEMISEILGIENPQEETIFKIISETQYDIQKFGVEHSKLMYGKELDIVYHYFTKQNELVEEEV